MPNLVVTPVPIPTPTPAPKLSPTEAYEAALNKYMQEAGVATGNVAGGGMQSPYAAPSAPSAGAGNAILPAILGAKLAQSAGLFGGAASAASGAGSTALAELPLAGTALQGPATSYVSQLGMGPTLENAALLEAPGTAATEGAGVLGAATPYVGLAGAGLGAYGLYNALKADDEKSGALSGAALGGGLAAAAPLLGFGPVGWGALGLAALGGGLGGYGLTSLFGHKSTKQYQKERWGGLQDDGVRFADIAYQANHPTSDDGIWDTGKYAGQKWSFDKALDLASEDPTHFQHVYGNYDTFGNDWGNYSDANQKAIVAALVKANLYNSSKGDVLIKDQDLARQIAQQTINPQATKSPGLTPEAKEVLDGWMKEKANT